MPKTEPRWLKVNTIHPPVATITPRTRQIDTFLTLLSSFA